MDPIALERRIHRLAVLLLGDHARAGAVVDGVLAARTLDPALVDRLTVLRTREVLDHERRGAHDLPGIPDAVARAIADLDYQAREAWVLGTVFALPLREVARAMDCSRTAARAHLDRAEAVFGFAGPEAAAAVRGALVQVAVPERHTRRRAGRRRRRRIWRIAWITVLAAAAVIATVAIAQGMGAAGG